MYKQIRIRYSQKDNPRGMLVELEYSLDGIEWHLVIATRVTKGFDHPWGDDVPDTYIHLDVLNRIRHLVSNGYRLVD